MKGIRKHGFSLVEIILSVVVLSIVSVISLKVFLLSDTLNEKAYALDQSVFMAESKMQELRKEAIDERFFYYSKDWEPLKNESDAVFVLKAVARNEGVSTVYKVTVLQMRPEKGQVIYELESKTFK